MASLNKQSLREEFDTLKGRFEKQCAAGEMTPDNRALFQALLMLLELVVAVFLEKHTPKTSTNSSRPSSQTAKDESALERPGARGKGKQLDTARSANTRTVETIALTKVAFCEHCGEDLGKIACQGHERRTQIDIVFEKVVSHVDAEIKQCPQCRKKTQAAFPDGFSGPLQYGAGIKAYMLNLLIAQMLSLKRVQQSIQTLIGLAISEATILKYVLQLHHALARWEESATAKLLAMPAMHVDETSLRVERKNHWIHVCSAGEITLKFLHRKRGKAAIEAIGLIPRYGGVMIHDCWASYLAYGHCGHGLCGAHLLRELTFIVDAEDYAWARDMKELLQQTCKRVSKRKRKKLNRPEYEKLQKHYRDILALGETELPPIPPRQNGKRGRIAKSDAHNLWERMKKHERAVLLFAKEAHVAFTNNRAERDLRMSKVKQKVSGCFRKREYAEAYCRISSYLQTMANRGYNPLVAIQMALSGELYAQGVSSYAARILSGKRQSKKTHHRQLKRVLERRD
ncbi:MAG: IS66 family transposase [Nitrococcus sp.]|nr:IS66 family transposase [Nitrococcus sp.]